MVTRLEKIRAACEWVEAKGNGGRDACRVSTSVKWADWTKKIFSPVMSALWWSETQNSRGDNYDTFWIPPPERWKHLTAKFLDVSEDWIETFASQCYDGVASPDRWQMVVTFDDVAGIELSNPKVEWKKIPGEPTELLPEARYCLEKYGRKNVVTNKLPYWTKNPPVELYESKVLSATYDLFEARIAAGLFDPPRAR